VKQAPQLSRPWLHGAFVLLFVGYGTKMGLAPMHTWKPDAYGEATGLVGALLAGGLTNCAFLSILRIYQIDNAAHDASYSQGILVTMGLISMLIAAISMSRQRDVKRLLAYSSVEHMGILAFGIGIGGAATAGALMHVIHNGLTKGVLFLSAGNIHRAFGTKSTDSLKGIVHRLPFSGAMFLAGFLAITGSPPFAPFVSEYQILSATLAGSHFWSAGLFALALLVVFIGMGSTVVSMLLGKPEGAEPTSECRERLGTCLPIAVFMALVVILGVYNPPDLRQLIEEAAKSLNLG
jgi:hydrogenase-4 component F